MPILSEDYCASCHHARSQHAESLFGCECSGKDLEQPIGAPQCQCDGFVEPLKLKRCKACQVRLPQDSEQILCDGCQRSMGPIIIQYSAPLDPCG